MQGPSAYPSLPGFNPHHDPTVRLTQKVDHKRVSAKKQEENRDYVTAT
jgi:hypothetical protein